MGHVGTYGENHAAETAALRVKDVKAVAEEIEVKLPYDVKHANKETADPAVNLMAWRVSIPKDSVRVAVCKGWVTLTDQVHSHYQLEAASDAVRTLWA